MRILVFMSDNRFVLGNDYNSLDYNGFVAAINYEYCKKHDYDFVYYRPYLQNKNEIKLLNCRNPTTRALRHASWSKLLSTSLALKSKSSYDYVVYIDSDCIFKDFTQTLEDFIMPHTDKDILFLNNRPWNTNKPCAGFYICKVNVFSQHFLRDWYNVNLPEKDTQHAWEQDALWKIYKHYNVGIIDGWMFREKKHQFLRHIGSNEKKNRIPYFTNFIYIHNIPLRRNLEEIHEFHENAFDTQKNGRVTRKKKL